MQPQGVQKSYHVPKKTIYLKNIYIKKSDNLPHPFINWLHFFAEQESIATHISAYHNILVLETLFM